MAQRGADGEPLGALAVRAGLVSREQLAECERLRAQMARRDGRRPSVLALLVARGYLSREDAARLRRQHGPAAPAPVPPKLRIPGYEILGRLGAGGMGTVYKARQLSLDRIVALKVLSPEVAREENYLRRFMSEARTLARLNHENIIAGIDVGEAHGYRYFAMEYVDGVSLDRLIEREGPLDDRRVLHIGMQIARALAHAHQHGLVHRDIKPQNIMIGPGDVAKLCDLGLAMTEEERREATERGGRSLGTPHYISPEQARGEQVVDIRADIYGLGATLYHAATGQTPFEGGSAMVLMTRHLTEEPIPAHKRRPGVSRHLSALIGAMMAKDREQRHQHPIELLEDMERVLRGKPPLRGQPTGGTARAADSSGSIRRRTTPRSGVRRLQQRRRRRRAPAGAWVALAMVLALSAAGAALWYRWQLEEQRHGQAAAQAGRPSPELQTRAYEALLAAMRYRSEHPEDRAGLRQLLEEVAARFAGTQAAEQARGYIDELGLGSEPAAPPPPPRAATPAGGAPDAGPAAEPGQQPDWDEPWPADPVEPALSEGP
ncbi:MAG: hypothetical protein KatS3mg102_1571 [Planctomycetota bacterium]|nr:MAG: hypothetical protein KatS3mg102_1571 [Planctomycetota bacterium]